MTTTPRKPKIEESTKTRKLRHHELKPRLHELYGTPKLNVRTGGVVVGGKEMSADEVKTFYLDLSNQAEEWPIGPTSDAIWSMAMANQFDPVADYLNGLGDVKPLTDGKWQSLDKHLLGIDNPVAANFLTEFFISAVARVLEPGCEARRSPVLVGPQERGKTSLGRILFGDSYWVEGLSDLSRDARMRCQTAWGVELSELDGITRKSQIEELKTFLTEREDSFRKPYGHGIIKTPRRFVFWGTSNHSPLRDLSGNSRFVCIGLPDRYLPLNWARENREALWAKALHEYHMGTDWRIVNDKERQARIEQNVDFQETDPWFDILEPFITIGRRHDECIRFEDIYNKLDISADRQNNVTARRIKQLIYGMGWVYSQKRIDGTKIRGFWKEAKDIDEGTGEELI